MVRPVPDGVLSVLAASSVTEIRHPVVGRVSVKVADLHPLRARTQEHLSDECVQIPQDLLAVQVVDGDHRVAVSSHWRLADLPLGSLAPGADTSEIGHL